MPAGETARPQPSPDPRPQGLPGWPGHRASPPRCRPSERRGLCGGGCCGRKRATRRAVGVQGSRVIPCRARGGRRAGAWRAPALVTPRGRVAGEAGDIAREGSPGCRSAWLIVASSARKMERPCLEPGCAAHPVRRASQMLSPRRPAHP